MVQRRQAQPDKNRICESEMATWNVRAGRWPTPTWTENEFV